MSPLLLEMCKDSKRATGVGYRFQKNLCRGTAKFKGTVHFKFYFFFIILCNIKGAFLKNILVTELKKKNT